MGCGWSPGRMPATRDFWLVSDHLPRPASDRLLSEPRTPGAHGCAPPSAPGMGPTAGRSLATTQNSSHRQAHGLGKGRPRHLLLWVPPLPAAPPQTQGHLLKKASRWLVVGQCARRPVPPLTAGPRAAGNSTVKMTQSGLPGSQGTIPALACPMPT